MTKRSGRKAALWILSILSGRLIGAGQYEKAAGTCAGRAESLPDHNFCAGLIPACKHHFVVEPDLHHAFVVEGIHASKANIHMHKLLRKLGGEGLLFQFFKEKIKRRVVLHFPHKITCLNLSN